MNGLFVSYNLTDKQYCQKNLRQTQKFGLILPTELSYKKQLMYFTLSKHLEAQLLSPLSKRLPLSRMT